MSVNVYGCVARKIDSTFFDTLIRRKFFLVEFKLETILRVFLAALLMLNSQWQKQKSSNS